MSLERMLRVCVFWQAAWAVLAGEAPPGPGPLSDLPPATNQAVNGAGFPLPAPWASEPDLGSTGPLAASNAVGASIVFATPVYDFGRIMTGEIVKHEFVFTNTGNALLLLSGVRPACGCTTTANWSRQVAPGGIGTIPIEFRSGNFNGPVVKEVIVSSNATNLPIARLQLRGTIWQPIEIVPPTALLTGVLDSPTNNFRIVRIINRDSEPLTLSEPVSNHRCVGVELRAVHPGQEYELVVRLLPPFGPGNVFGEISVKTSSPKMALLRIPAWAVGQPAVAAIPFQVVLPAGPNPNRFTNSVSIRSLWDQPLRLSKPTLDAPGVDVQVVELQPGRYYTLQLTFPPGFQLARNQRLQLRIPTNHPQFPVLGIPIIQRAARFDPTALTRIAQPVPRPTPPTPGR